MPNKSAFFGNGGGGGGGASPQSRRSSPLAPSSISASGASSCTASRSTAHQLLALDSVFYQPKRWQSWYVKKLTCDLSIERHRASKQRQQQQSSSLAARDTYSYQRNNSNSASANRIHYSSNYSANTSTSSSTATSSFTSRPQTPSASTMIKARHQFSTIRTNYSDVAKTYISDVNPLRAMLVQVDFEVFGDVSGVYFTKYAKSMCESLNIKGWIRVSPKGTVYGQIQGEKEKVDEMALWLRLQGSPNSKIQACEFKNWQIIDSCDFRNFNIRY